MIAEGSGLLCPLPGLVDGLSCSGASNTLAPADELRAGLIPRL